jgi:hypothetical protein
MTSGLELRALAYRRIARGSLRGAGLIDSARQLGTLVGREAATVLDADRAGDARETVDDHVLSSTILSALVMDDSPHGAALRDEIARCTGRPVDWLTHAYECAGWGYVIRHALDKAALTGRRTLLLQIVDVDIHDFTYWCSNPRWGQSGFGICSIVLHVAPGATWPLALGAAEPASAMVQMGRALRDFSAARPGVPVAVPFLREASRKLLLQRIAGAPVHPDGYARFGHSFGSDPWISLLLGARAGRSIVNSLALYGYFAIAEINIAPDATMLLDFDA